MSNKLFSFRRCPYAIRARMAIEYSQFPVEIIEVDLKNKPEEMLQYSAKGTVPVLVLQDGTVIDESLDIIKWALSKNDPDGWLAKNLDEHSEPLIKANDNTFKKALDLYKYSERHPQHCKEYYREQALHFIRTLEHCLEKNKFVVDNEMSMADIAIFPFIRQFAFVDKHWFDNTDYIHVQRWLGNLLDSELFKTVMKKKGL